MSTVPDIPAAPFVPQYPALGSSTFNQEAYTYGSSMPGVTLRIHEIAQAARACALAVQSDAIATEAARAQAVSASDSAMGYRNSAQSSATAAAGSATLAGTHASTATAALTSMQVMYLGSKVVNSHPTTDNMGNPLQAGALYTNTGTNAALNKRGYWWDGVAWQLAWGDITGVYMPTTGGTFTGPINVPAGATGNQAPRASEVVPISRNWPEINLKDLTTSGFHRINTYTGGSGGVDLSYSQFIVCRGGDTIFQLGAPFNRNYGPLVFRRGNPSEVGGTGQFYDWEKVLSSGWVVETQKVTTLAAGTTTYAVDPSEGSVHYVVINGPVTFNLPAQGRQLGDQVTLRILSNGGVRPITMSSNVYLPVGQSLPTYAAGQIITLTLFYGRTNAWDCFIGGVHQ